MAAAAWRCYWAHDVALPLNEVYLGEGLAGGLESGDIDQADREVPLITRLN
jgi:hypothetical protein